jgi:hypothetical protein
MSTNELEVEVRALVMETLRDLAEEKQNPEWEQPHGKTRIYGGRSNIDSLGLVGVTVELEERIAERFDRHVALADDRAVSQRRSPFATVDAMTGYILTLLREARGAEASDE